MPETFSPLLWRNDQSPALNEINLNRLEAGVEVLDDRIATLENGVVTPVTVPYSTSVTLNATQGARFRCVASGDLTLDDIVGGTDGQVISFEVQASGARRTLHFTGLTDSVDIAVGQWWVGTFRFIAEDDAWLLDDNSGGSVVGNLSIAAIPGLQTTLDDKVGSTTVDNIVVVTQAVYNAISTPDPRILYVITA